MLISELAESAKYVILHFYLRNEGYTLWEGIYFTTPSSTFSLATLCVLFERDVVEPENVEIFTENVDIFVALVIPRSSPPCRGSASSRSLDPCRTRFW